jgi:hypothetical protein
VVVEVVVVEMLGSRLVVVTKVVELVCFQGDRVGLAMNVNHIAIIF